MGYIIAFFVGMGCVYFVKSLFEIGKILSVFWRDLDRYHPDAYDFTSQNDYFALPPLGKTVIRTMLIFKRVKPYDGRKQDV